MYKSVVIISASIILCLACQEENSTEGPSPITGQWAHYDKYLLYTEIYIDVAEIHVNTGAYGTISFPYQLKNDAIYSLNATDHTPQWMGKRNKEGKFEFAFFEGEIILQEELSGPEEELSLKELLIQTQPSNAKKLYTQYHHDRQKRELRFMKAHSPNDQ